MEGTLLVIDDDEASCRLVRATFNAEGVNVLVAHDGPDGVTQIARDNPDVVLLDIGLPSGSGVDLLEQIKQSNPWLPVVMLTASREITLAVRATRLGALDYLTKPVDHDNIISVVRRGLEARALHREVEELRNRLIAGESNQLAFEMGTSASVKKLFEQVALVTASNLSVLIVGETGSGKDLVARAIHRQSDRRSGPFIAVDCGAIPEPLLESELFGHEKGAFTGADRRRTGQLALAGGGTCFLDEIGNLPVSLQAKLLRVLDSRQVQPVGAERPTMVDVRFIAASNEDMRACARDGRFRADLYFRLAQYTIAVPPLRERPEDIPYLTQRFLEDARVALRRPVQHMDPDAIAILEQYEWPGNVRELRNVVWQAVLRSRDLTIQPADVRALLTSAPARGTSTPAPIQVQSLKEVASEATRAAECQAICEALRATRGNKSAAAKALQTDYKTLHLKMKSLGIRARDFIP